jgi:REP element-mobilizing transposase RayT
LKNFYPAAVARNVGTTSAPVPIVAPNAARTAQLLVLQRRSIDDRAMPQPGMAWRHVIVTTLYSWHHGDPRGFRSRGHRIHSSGDYKNPPPAGEHAGLLRYHKSVSGEAVDLAQDIRAVIGRALVAPLLEMNFRVLAASVSDRHAHVVVELPIALATVKMVIGNAKRKSSRAVKEWLPGRVWAAGGTYKQVKDRSHLKNATEYVLYEQGDDAWTWSYKDATTVGRFGRRRPNPGGNPGRR